MSIAVALEAAWGGRSVPLDGIIAVIGRLEADVMKWREQCEMDGLLFAMNGGAVQSHPLIDRVLRAEYLIEKNLTHCQLLITALPDNNEDEFDSFLRSLEDRSKPIHKRNQ